MWRDGQQRRPWHRGASRWQRLACATESHRLSLLQEAAVPAFVHQVPGRVSESLTRTSP